MMYLIVNMSVPITTGDVYNVLMHFFDNSTTADAIMTAYPLTNYVDEYSRLSNVLRDFMFRCNIRQMVRSIRQVTGPTVPTWIYRFNKTHDNPVQDLAGDYHGSELPYVFNNGWTDWQAADFTLSKQMGCYWSSMAIHGDPNLSGCDNVIEWPENTGPAGDYNIALDFVLRTQAGLSETQCDFWDTVGYN
jgi:carboxylesterase type B